MSPRERLSQLRHDLKYVGMTARNLSPHEPVPAWAARAIEKDIVETRHGRSCLALVEEAAQALQGLPLAAELRALVSAAEALSCFRPALARGEVPLAEIVAALQTLQQALQALAQRLTEVAP